MELFEVVKGVDLPCGYSKYYLIIQERVWKHSLAGGSGDVLHLVFGKWAKECQEGASCFNL